MIEEKIFENDLEGARSYLDKIAKAMRDAYGFDLHELRENDPVSDMSGMPSKRYSMADKEGIIHVLIVQVSACYPKPREGDNYTHFIYTFLKESEEGPMLKRMETASGRVINILDGIRLRQQDFEKADRYFRKHFVIS